jgi:hypothetical protein
MSSTLSLSDPKRLFNYLVGKKELESAVRAFPWYDAVWLRKYVAAKKVIERVRPDMVGEFTYAFARLRTRPDFVVTKIEHVFDNEVIDQIQETIKTLPAEAYENHEIERFGRRVIHDHPFFTELQKAIQPRVCELAGEPVEASYNFLSLYSRIWTLLLLNGPSMSA